MIPPDLHERITGACASLEHGFHQGRSITGSEELETGITYAEF
jgi:hypothetical protein